MCVCVPVRGSLRLVWRSLAYLVQEFNDIWLMPFGTGVWHKMAYSGRLPPLVNTAVALVETMIYIFGGFSRGVALNNLFVYNTSTQLRLTATHHTLRI